MGTSCSCSAHPKPRVSFAQSIRTHVEVPPSDYAGATIRGVLESVFEDYPRLRSYLLDDRGAVRKHVNIVINGVAMVDREELSDAINDDAEIVVMQALSGG